MERDFKSAFLPFALREKGLGDEGQSSASLIYDHLSTNYRCGLRAMSRVLKLNAQGSTTRSTPPSASARALVW